MTPICPWTTDRISKAPNFFNLRERRLRQHCTKGAQINRRCHGVTAFPSFAAARGVTARAAHDIRHQHGQGLTREECLKDVSVFRVGNRAKAETGTPRETAGDRCLSRFQRRNARRRTVSKTHCRLVKTQLTLVLPAFAPQRSMRSRRGSVQRQVFGTNRPSFPNLDTFRKCRCHGRLMGSPR